MWKELEHAPFVVVVTIIIITVQCNEPIQIAWLVFSQLATFCFSFLDIFIVVYISLSAHGKHLYIIIINEWRRHYSKLNATVIISVIASRPHTRWKINNFSYNSREWVDMWIMGKKNVRQRNESWAPLFSIAMFPWFNISYVMQSKKRRRSLAILIMCVIFCPLVVSFACIIILPCREWLYYEIGIFCFYFDFIYFVSRKW